MMNSQYSIIKNVTKIGTSTNKDAETQLVQTISVFPKSTKGHRISTMTPNDEVIFVDANMIVLHIK